MLDYKPEVVAANSEYWIPVTRFRGDPKDATLLYLEKYLLSIAEEPDVSKWIARDFKDQLKRRPR